MIFLIFQSTMSEGSQLGKESELPSLLSAPAPLTSLLSSLTLTETDSGGAKRVKPCSTLAVSSDGVSSFQVFHVTKTKGICLFILLWATLNHLKLSLLPTTPYHMPTCSADPSHKILRYSTSYIPPAQSVFLSSFWLPSRELPFLLGFFSFLTFCRQWHPSEATKICCRKGSPCWGSIRYSISAGWGSWRGTDSFLHIP